MAPVLVRPVVPADHDRWRELHRGYTAFYGVEHTDELSERVWSWLQDPGHELEGLVAEAASGRVVGFAHVRPFVRPLGATTAGFLDDLFVDPEHRGTGVADALLARLRVMAAERGWSTVRWITSDDNYRARAKYDQVATRTMLVTYDMAEGPRPQRWRRPRRLPRGRARPG